MCEGKVPLIQGPPQPGASTTGPLTSTEWTESKFSRWHIVSRCRGPSPYPMVQDAVSQDSAGNPFLGRHPLGETLNHRKFCRGCGRAVLTPHHQRSLYIHPFVRIINIPTIPNVHSGNIALFIVDVNGKIAWGVPPIPVTCEGTTPSSP